MRAASASCVPLDVLRWKEDRRRERGPLPGDKTSEPVQIRDFKLNPEGTDGRGVGVRRKIDRAATHGGGRSKNNTLHTTAAGALPNELLPAQSGHRTTHRTCNRQLSQKHIRTQPANEKIRKSIRHSVIRGSITNAG